MSDGLLLNRTNAFSGPTGKGGPKLKLIKDIRLLESDVPNVDGNATPYYMGKLYLYDHMECLDVIQRLLFLLRHRGFGFHTFDHLYVNFTPCVPHGEVRNVNRYNIREFSWYEYVDIGCDVTIFNHLAPEEKNAFVLDAIKKAALLKAPEDQRQLFADTFSDVLREGSRLLLPYKQKENQDYSVQILTRINDDVDFIPLIRVTDKSGALKVQQELRCYGRDEFISQIGTVTIGKHSLRIVPRKNWYADFYNLKPIKLEW